MLVRPGGAQAGVVDDLEDRVVAEVVPWGDRLAGLRVDREGGRVERRARVELQVHDRGGVGVDTLGVDRTVLVERRERAVRRVDEVVDVGQRVVRRVVDDVTTGGRLARGAGSARLVGLVAVLDVVVDAGGLGVAAGHQRGAARVGVRRVGRRAHWCTRCRRASAWRASSPGGGRCTSQDHSGACHRPRSAVRACSWAPGRAERWHSGPETRTARLPTPQPVRPRPDG